MRFAASARPSGVSAGEPGRGDLQADRGAGARRRVLARGNRPRRVRSTQAAMAARLASLRAIRPSRPPTLSAQRSPSSASSTHSIDGVLIVSPLKMPSISLPPEVRRKIFGSGQAGLVGQQPLDGARRQRQHAVRRLAAQHLLPGPGHDIELVPRQRHREGGRGGVADRQALAVGGDPVAVGNAHARGGAVPGEHHVACEIDRGEVGQLAVGRLQHARIRQLELLDDVVRPAGAEAFEGQDIDAAGAEQRPQRHLDRAGVGRRHDAELPVGRHAEDGARAVDHLGEARLRLAWRDGCGRAARRRARPGESRDAWRRGRRRNRDWPDGCPACAAIAMTALPFRREAPRWGGVARRES